MNKIENDVVRISDHYQHNRNERLVMKCFSTHICPLCKASGGCKLWTSSQGIKLIVKLIEKEGIDVTVE